MSYSGWSAGHIATIGANNPRGSSIPGVCLVHPISMWQLWCRIVDRDVELRRSFVPELWLNPTCKDWAEQIHYYNNPIALYDSRLGITTDPLLAEEPHTTT